MKIYLKPFTKKHKFSALKRIFEVFVFGKIKLHELNRVYLAMLYLERYMERINSN